MIRIDQIRALLSVGAKTANYHAGKLLVLAPASALNRNAANALLKFLEEPPANTYLLLVASRTSELPATVISRCQRVSVERPSAVQALEFLREGGLSEGRSLELMNLANGEPLVALQIEESGSADTLLRVLNVVEALLNGHASARDLGREAQGIDADLLLMVLIAGAHQAAVAAVNQELMPSNWLSWHKALVELYGKYLRSPNINIPLALEQLCVTIR
jgi:DNA polymerase-3 subunit delta'